MSLNQSTSTFTRIIDGKEHSFEVTISKQEDGVFVVSKFTHTPPEGWTGWVKPASKSNEISKGV